MLLKNDHNIVVGNTLLYHPLTLQRKAVKWQKEHTHTKWKRERDTNKANGLMPFELWNVVKR